MFTSLKRQHYNEATLVWLSITSHWRTHIPGMYDLLKKWITLAYEYPVENTHGVIRAQTRHSETATQLVNKVKSIVCPRPRKQTSTHISHPQSISLSHMVS